MLNYYWPIGFMVFKCSVSHLFKVLSDRLTMYQLLVVYSSIRSAGPLSTNLDVKDVPLTVRTMEQPCLGWLWSSGLGFTVLA